MGCRRVGRSSYVVLPFACSYWSRGHVTACACYITGGDATSAAAASLVARTATLAQLLAPRPRHCLRLLHYRWLRDVGCRRVARGSYLVQLLACSSWPRGHVTAYTCYITVGYATSAAAASVVARTSYSYPRSYWPRGRAIAYTCYITGCRAVSAAAASLGARSSYSYSRAVTGHAATSLPAPAALQVATRRRLPPRRS